ncbi:uncharacterized protein BKA55DRAFT_698023 [Fusarium redolens]|uniref:Uncharacterized protein n=1 Tax=Fusarium redolens TaxID=48865 RepID=A0A9P9JPN7_FUSRE|nr:uncharacterized protein BKA55DRAFT_698023 [Fusarium redolens]KAH7210894.1 hypothetical protein BKA55DRAFT_698023 [Fusarium redolens]
MTRGNSDLGFTIKAYPEERKLRRSQEAQITNPADFGQWATATKNMIYSTATDNINLSQTHVHSPTRALRSKPSLYRQELPHTGSHRFAARPRTAILCLALPFRCGNLKRSPLELRDVADGSRMPLTLPNPAASGAPGQLPYSTPEARQVVHGS